MADERIEEFSALTGGMNSGIEPGLIASTFYNAGVNVTSRRGYLQTRPAFVKVADLAAGTFQGAGRWSLDAGEHLVVVISGTIYVLAADSGALEATFASAMDATAQCFFCQPDRWLLIQDGVSRPAVLSLDAGVFSLYRNPADAIPVSLVTGTVGVYAHGRIHYVPTLLPLLTPDSTITDVVPNMSTDSGLMYFVSSDVLDTLDPQWVFRMSEHRVVNEGGAMALPFESGYITAMGVLRGAATGTGVGAIIVFGREGVSAFDLSSARSQWKEVSVSQVLFTGVSTLSPWSLANVNGDLMFIDTEGGVRSLGYVASKTKNGLDNTPMSNELTVFAGKVALDHASATCVDNRFLATFCGEADNYFKGLISMDFAPLYTLGGASSTVYDGLWTGFKFEQVLSLRRNGVLTLFAVVRNGSVHAVLVLDDTVKQDLSTTDIEAQVITRGLSFAGSDGAYPYLKQLQYVELWLQGMTSDVEVEVSYRPVGYPYWTSLGTKTVNVPAGSAEQSRRRLHFGVDFSTEVCNSATQQNLYVADSFQFLIKWTGYAKLERFRAVVKELLETMPECADDNADDATLSGGTLEDYFSYEVLT